MVAEHDSGRDGGNSELKPRLGLSVSERENGRSTRGQASNCCLLPAPPSSAPLSALISPLNRCLRLRALPRIILHLSRFFSLSHGHESGERTHLHGVSDGRWLILARVMRLLLETDREMYGFVSFLYALS